MAGITAPLLSFDGSGQVAKSLVYATWKGRPYVRRYVIPANPNSSGQQLTRNTFKFLTQLWKYLPAGATSAWQAYGNNSRITEINAFLKQNTGLLRTASDLSTMIMSPSANGGLAASAIALTAGANQIQVDLTEPALPSGWTITAAMAMAIPNVDPQSSTLYEAVADMDATTPYSITLTGLTSAQEYVVGGWFIFDKGGTKIPYGQAITDLATPT